jgi:outer membrane protein OmpA-like peptidoglycan-associated protein/uncharacterized membrane protein (UPF0127 family)
MRTAGCIATASGVHALSIRLADGFRTRLRGLMLAPPPGAGEAMLITRCASVHTCFMRQAIDVVYLDAEGRVLRCRAGLKPWRGSWQHGARHVLELAGGSCARLGIAPGDRLEHPSLCAIPGAPKRQGGAAMIEFAVIAPALMLIGLALLQYSLMYVAKNQVNHAGFMAARAGSMHHATVQSISAAYLRSLAPMYGGGGNPAEISEAVARASADMQGNYRIELVNPRKASFDDFNDPALQRLLKTSARVIPNAGLALKDPSKIGTASKQTIFDANLLKLRITHGYRPKVLLMSRIYAEALHDADDHKDAFVSQLIDSGRVPVVTDVTLHMNSDAIEWADASWLSSAADPASPGPAEPPRPQDPGQPPSSVTGQGNGDQADPPEEGENGGADKDNACGKKPCPVCEVKLPETESLTLSADVLFDFDKAALKPEGRDQLEQIIDDIRQAQQDGQAIESVSVSGYTDQLGSDAVNQRLSLERAQAVRDYMRSKGLADVPFTVRGMGAADPQAPLSACSGGGQQQIDCLAPNRRVVIEVRRALKNP